MICAIVLAAGQSRRMGGQKLLLPFAGRTVLEHIVHQVVAGPLEGAVVVVGQDKGVAEAAATLQASDSCGPAARVRVVVNPDPVGEMLSSVRCGLAALAAECDGVLVVLGDQPSITAGLVDEMVRAFRASGGGIVVPVHGGRRGHPLLFSIRYRDEIMAGYDQVGLRGLLQTHGHNVYELPVTTASVLADMDLPEDYKRELARLESRA